MVGGLISIVGGILAASGFIISKKPNAKELIDKLVPYQGWVGVVMLGWGVWELIGCLTGMALLSISPVWWIFWLLTGISDPSAARTSASGSLPAAITPRMTPAVLRW